MNHTLSLKGKYHIECWEDATKKRLLWSQDIENKITNQGLDQLNNEVFYTTAKLSNAWYLALVNTDTTAAATMTYATPVYTESTSIAARPAWGSGASSSMVVTNASAAVFTNTGTTETIYGISLVGANAAGVTTPGDKAATGGTLFSYGKLGTAQPWVSGNIINVTYSVTSASTT